MQPNEQPQYSIDYLDQIASPPQKQGSKDKILIIVIIVGVIVATIVGFFLLMGSGGGNKSDMARLAARLQTLQSVSDSSQPNIKSGALRGTNTNLSLFLTSTNRAVTEPIEANGIVVEKLDPKITTSENGKELKDRLEDARLNAVFDRTYAREMTYQLEALSALMQQIESNTKNRSFKETLATARKQLEPLGQQFEEFTAASS